MKIFQLIMLRNLLSIFTLSFLGSVYAQTTTSGSYVFDGQTREYRVYIPAAYDGSTPVPLVFNLHGYGSNNVEQEQYGDFRSIADTANFIIVHPMGLVDLFGSTHWNAFGTSDVDDVGFLSSLIDTIYAAYNIDGNRIYSTGMSNGGFMSHKLACLLSGRIAAIASVTGSITTTEIDACITNHPMPVMQIHGTADETVPYEGNVIFMPVEDVVAHWVSFNECTNEPITTELPDIDPTDGCTVTHYLYEDGLLGSTVEFYKVTNGGHTWPGSAFDIGETTYDFNASKEIWRFFSQYSMIELTSGVAEEEAGFLFDIYPNPSNESVVNLSFSGLEDKLITVTNLMGQVIFQETVSQTNVEINLENQGIYLVTVEAEGQIWTEKIIRN
jgi:polyhydroxybutyrate depolymerase